MSDESYWAEVLQAADDLRELLGLSPTFFTDLKSDNDWSFTIKVHALLETTVTSVLQARLDPLPVSEFVATLDFSGGRSTKLKLASQLGLLEPEHERFLRALSHIRNRLAHNIRNVAFDLAGHVATLSMEQKTEFFRNLCFLFYDESAPKSERDRIFGKAISSPRRYVWACSIYLLGWYALHHSIIRDQSRIALLSRQRLELELESMRYRNRIERQA